MNYREIDLNLLLILDAMYDAGSTTQAAERLKISQPTVSFCQNESKCETCY